MDPKHTNRVIKGVQRNLSSIQMPVSLYYIGSKTLTINISMKTATQHTRIQKVFSEGFQLFWCFFFFSFFLSWLGERGSNYHYKPAIICPPAWMTFHWRADGGLTLTNTDADL